MELFFYTIQYFSVFTAVLFYLTVQKRQKALWIMSVMLYKVRIDDRMDICYISMCFYLVILNKVKLNNGLTCLTAVGFEAERRHVWRSCNLCCYKSSYG